MTTWVAPDIVPADELFQGGEREMLQGFLQNARESLLKRCAGLTADQLVTRSSPPSTLSLLGIVRHLTDVERIWFRIRFAGEEVALPYRTAENADSAFDEAVPERAAADIARYRAEWTAVDAALSGLALDDTYQSPRWGVMNLRWAYLHTIREYSGHCGQADIIRERIDGRTQS
jgi:uncharacterized damage-inducible protein DinB